MYLKYRVLELLCVGGIVVCANRAMAAIDYVDATDTAAGNTALAAGGTFTGIDPQGPANDGMWDKRAFSNSATIFQNAGTDAGADDAARLVTTASVPDGTYDVYAYFWSDSSNTWRMRASLADSVGDLPLYLPGDAGVTQFYSGSDATVFSSTLTPNPFTSDVMIAEGNRRLYQIALGQVTGTSVAVYIDDMGAGQTTQSERTWYDGIGYAVIPEPASAALLIFGAMGATLATRRRRT